jgi:5-methylcytosine-specific restriction endonuclease McrA
MPHMHKNKINSKNLKLVEKKHKKKQIPSALREQVWITHAGPIFQRKCFVYWCKNKITAFDFHCGHNIPESKGGRLTIDNLVPICARCNLSMGNTMSIDEWNQLATPVSPVSIYSKLPRWLRFLFCIW